MDNYTTISKIAKDLEVTKEAVRKKMKLEPLATKLQKHTNKVGNMIHISKTGEILIKSTFKDNYIKKETTTVCDHSSQLISNEVVDLEREIIELKEELKNANEHNRKISLELIELTKESHLLNRSNQVLLGQSQNRIMELEAPPEKKSWFKRKK
jgi:hypothetical protein